MVWSWNRPIADSPETPYPSTCLRLPTTSLPTTLTATEKSRYDVGRCQNTTTRQEHTIGPIDFFFFTPVLRYERKLSRQKLLECTCTGTMYRASASQIADRSKWESNWIERNVEISRVYNELNTCNENVRFTLQGLERLKGGQKVSDTERLQNANYSII